MNQRNELYLLYSLVLLLILTPLLLLNTGIDIFDEGYYLQGYVREQNIFFQYSGFHFLVRLLPFSENIVIARIYRIVLLIAVAIILGKVLQRKVFTDKSSYEVIAYVLLGNFLTYVHLPSTISYNTLSLIFLELLLTGYLYFRNLTYSNSKTFVLPVVLFSIVLGLQAFNKPTSALLFALLFAVDQAIYRLPHWKDYFKIILLTGFISLLTFFILIALNYGDKFWQIIQIFQSKDNPFNEGHLSLRFLISQLLIIPLLQSKKFVLYTFGYLLVYILAKRYRYEQHYVVQIVFTAITLIVLYQYRKVYFNQPGAEYLFAFLLFYLMAWVLYYLKNPQIKSKIDWHLVLALFCLPYIGFWGSNNPPMLGIIHYMVFPLLLIVYLNQYLQLKFVRFLPVLLVGFTLYNFIWAPFYNPPVFNQNYKLNVRGTVMRVSDYVHNRNSVFDSISYYISHQLPLIPVDVPNGLLYVHRLKGYLTLYFNSPEFTVGYLKLIQMKGLPDKAQILVHKLHRSDAIERALNKFLQYVAEKNYQVQLLNENSEYKLYVIFKNKNKIFN